MGTEPSRSHYTILGVGPRATSKEIRVAYLNLARALHPDRVRSGSPAEQQLAGRRMREVNEAYEVLKDTARRQAYDRDHGVSTARPTSGSGSGTGGASRAPGGPSAATDPSRPRARPPGNPERFDADPAWREQYPGGHSAWMDDVDDVEVSPFVAFVLQRGPLIAVLVLAAFLFIATAYAGGGASDEPGPTAPTSIECPDPSTTSPSGGSVDVQPC
jgi:hypothetical protein